jgi:serine/threonine protein kinase
VAWVRLPFQLDRYTLVEAIGAGAFGRVYRAEVRGDMGFVTEVAVKVLDANVVAMNPNVARQMADEARILSQLDHPNIVKVIDFKHVDHGLLGDIYFMVMEYVRGVDVSQILEFLEDQGGEMIPADKVLHMGLMTTDALVHAHEFVSRDGHALHLVHRDLKPQNLMVNFRGQVKVLDFGIAKAKDHRMAQRTQEGQTKGTVFYMSPEQLAGEELDARSDLYSVGTILFEMLLGRRLLDVEVSTPADLARAMHTAFELDIDARLEVLRSHLTAEGSGPLSEEAIEGWMGLLRAALHKDPRYRPDSARMMSEQLEWLRGRHPTGSSRDYWSRIVARAAQSRATSDPSDDPTLAVDRPTDVEESDEPTSGAYAILGASTHEFFGMQTDGRYDDEDSGPGHGPVEVPVTREMSVVRGTVRTFGSSHIQEIGPLPELLKEIDITSRSSIKVVPDPEVSAGELPTTRPPPRRRSQPTTVETQGVKARPTSRARSRSSLAKQAEASARADVRSEARSLAEAATSRSARPTSKADGPDRTIVLAVVAGLLLLVAILVLVMVNRTPPRDPEPSLTGAVEVPEETTVPEPVESTVAEAARAATEPQAEATPKPVQATPVEVAPEPTPKPKTMAATPKPRPAVAESPKPKPKAKTKTKPKAKPTPKVAAAEPEAPAQFTIGARPTATTGTLHLAAIPRCRIEIDGEEIGTSDETRKGVAVLPGTYVVRFFCDETLEPECAKLKRKGAKKTLKVKAGEAKRFKANFFELNELD